MVMKEHVTPCNSVTPCVFEYFLDNNAQRNKIYQAFDAHAILVNRTFTVGLGFCETCCFWDIF